jgi:hypothetical protein
MCQYRKRRSSRLNRGRNVSCITCGFLNSNATPESVADPPGAAWPDAAISICVVRFAAAIVSAALLAAQGAVPAVRAALPAVVAATLDDSRITVSSVAVAAVAAAAPDASATDVVRLALLPVVAVFDAFRPCPSAVRVAALLVCALAIAASAIEVDSAALDAVVDALADAIPCPAVSDAAPPVWAELVDCIRIAVVSAELDLVAAAALDAT